MFSPYKLILLIVVSGILVLSGSRSNAQSQVSGLADTPWPMYQHDAQHTGRSPFIGALQKPELLWTAQLPECSGESGGISIAEDGSLLISIGGCLSNFDPNTRTLRWVYEYTSHSRSVPLVSTDQNHYWGQANTFMQLSPSGIPNWVAELDANLVFGSSPTFGTDENLYFVHDGVWSFTTAGDFRWFNPYGDYGSHASPAIGIDGNIYAGTWIGDLDICAYSPSGSIPWCLDIPGVAYDRTVSVGVDGTIYVPTEGNPVFPYTDSGVLVAVDPAGSFKWKFKPDESNIFNIPDGIALGPDGSIKFGLNTLAEDSYLYSIDSTGQYQWKVPFVRNPLTGLQPWLYHPITVDKLGNTYLCLENSHCYGIDPNGTILWDIDFQLIDSIITVSSTQPVIAQNGIFYLVDSNEQLFAYADPSQFPILKTSTKYLDLSITQNTPVFTTTVPITSTALPITFTASISPVFEGLSITNPVNITPAQLNIIVEPASFPTGIYHATIKLEPGDPLGSPITIPLNLRVGIDQAYLTQILSRNQPDRILYTSHWFEEYQFASIRHGGDGREAISHDLPIQIDDISYSPDGRKVALQPLINGLHQIHILDTETGETILEIADASHVQFPSWSPDSQRILFVTYKDDTFDGEVYVINLDGTGLTRLTNNKTSETGMFWSPDGQKIAVQIRYTQLYIMNSDGSDFHQVVTGNLRDLIQGWSPDGKYLLLASHKANSTPYGLGKFELQTGVYTYLAENFDSGAKWSPDGSRITYVAHEVENQFDWDIFVINADGSSELNLTHDMSQDDSQPGWSPNSQWIVFSSRNDDSYNDPNYDIYVIKMDGTGLHQVTTNIQYDYFPFWKP